VRTVAGHTGGGGEEDGGVQAAKEVEDVDGFLVGLADQENCTERNRIERSETNDRQIDKSQLLEQRTRESRNMHLLLAVDARDVEHLAAAVDDITTYVVLKQVLLEAASD
jgi:hypothetical protein